jgi:hypothetical protein
LKIVFQSEIVFLEKQEPTIRPNACQGIPDVRREANFAGSSQAVAQFPGVDPLPLNGVII